MFEPERENRLLNLAGNRAFLRQEQVLGELLGQRRAALHAAASSDIARQRPHDAERVDSEMGVKAAVLDGDESLGQIGRQFRKTDRRAAGVAAIGQKLPSAARMAMLGGRLGMASWSIGGNCEP